MASHAPGNSRVHPPTNQNTQLLDQEASQLILNALDRTNSAQSPSQPPPSSLKVPESSSRSSGSFGKMAFNSMMGGLSVLSLTRTNTNNSTTGEDKESRGRSMLQHKRSRSTSAAPAQDTDASRSRSRARSQSPFNFRRFRQRDPSPTPQPLPMAQSDMDFASPPIIQPQTAFFDDADSGDENNFGGDAESEDEWSDNALLDPVTERNTERNAQIASPTSGDGSLACLELDVDLDPDPLGEGVNVIVPPEPYFPSTLDSFHGTGSSSQLKEKKGPRRRKSTRHLEPLPLHTSRPIFKRDRCTIVVTQGDPEEMLKERRRRTYVVASDLSEESRYAVEWGIGTVLRDGDEMMIVTIIENESKVDPQIPNAADRAVRLRSQQERQGLAYILVRQANGLLQRTRLHVKVSCQAWHAKNARHILLDVVDYYEPTMLIVGSRGLGQLKGILLGSTSHYLIQKCSVPVMVARRRLKRPPRRSAHLNKHRARVSLAEAAGIDRVVPKADRDVKTMLEEVGRDDERRDASSAHGLDEGEEGDGDDDEPEESALGVKVPG